MYGLWLRRLKLYFKSIVKNQEIATVGAGENLIQARKPFI